MDLALALALVSAGRSGNTDADFALMREAQDTITKAVYAARKNAGIEQPVPAGEEEQDTATADSVI